MGDFDKLLRKEMPVLERFVRFRIGNAHDADDVLQETCIAAFRNFDGLKDENFFKPWLLGIARHKCNDYFREKAKSMEIPIDELREPAFSYGVQGVTTVSVVRETLDLLGDKDKHILYLYYFKDLPQDEIAKRLGLPLGTVKSRLHNAKQRFKKKYPYIPKGESEMKQLPEKMPEYKITKIDKPPFEVRWEELMGWFIVPKPGEKLADSFEKSFSEKADLVKKLDFYGNCFGMERLGYIAVPFVLRNLVSKTKTKLHFENGAYPVRKDGGHGWFIVAETEDECEIADDYSAGCNVAGDDSGSASAMGSHIYYYWVNKYFKSSIYHGFGIRWMCAESIPQNSENGFIKTELNDESAAQLIRNNLIIKSGNGYMLNFACFSREAFDEFISLFEIENKKISTALSEWIKELRKGFSVFVPKRLDSQINQWVSCYANRLAGYVTEELIGRGVLETPQNEVSFTDGVFYVEGEYINNI